MMGNVDHQHNGFNEYSTPLDLLNSGQLVKICAPMVRYSRLAFRSLVRKYNCDIAYSPMIIAESFVQSVKARDSDFTTNSYDQPLIVQFAANNANIFADAAQIVAPYADGVDINCGCPQRWAMQEGYGACLLRKPQLLSEMISAARSHIKQPSDKFTISIKIRLHNNIVDTVDLCRKAVHAGVSFITVHGRTPVQRCQPIDTGAIRLLADTVGVPVVANGDIRSLGDALSIQQQTGVNGVMSARGLLANPAMFAGYDSTPLQCVADWVDISTQLGIPFQAFHQHLMFMLDGVFSKAERRIFNSLSSTSAILDYLTHVCGIPHLQSTTLAASN